MHRVNSGYVLRAQECRNNLLARFAGKHWLGAVDFSKFAVVAGCVLNGLCTVPFEDTRDQDVNLVYYAKESLDFKQAVQDLILKLRQMQKQFSTDEIKVEKVSGMSNFIIILASGVRLNISLGLTGNAENALSHVLYSMDMDISQVAYMGESSPGPMRLEIFIRMVLGDKIVCTFGFLESLASRSFILYTLHERSAKHHCIRVQKYCNRGFDLLEPKLFDNCFANLMKQTEIPIYRIEQYQFVNGDGELQTATREYYRANVENIDMYHLQESFINSICP
jgi:hypothetical protein